jgi:hypothetical protein
MVTLSSDDFEDPTAGTCGMGSWSIVSGTTCTDAVDSGGPCSPGSPGNTCCDDTSTILYDLGGDCVLRTDRDTNCGGTGDSREWRIGHDYDTTGLSDLEICLSIASDSATSNDGILIYAEDPGHGAQVFCQMGSPVWGAVDLEWPYCAPLPSWAEDNPDLTLTIIAHSHDDRDVLYVDDVVVKGWTDSCTPSRSTVFTEDFDPCPVTDPIPSGWNGWTISTVPPGDGPACLTVCTGGSAGGVRAENEQLSMSHVVDTSAVDGDVRLCFFVGDDHSDAGEWISVWMDAGGGTTEVWYWDTQWGTDGACGKVCVGLSDVDPRAARNPGLVVGFTIASNSTGDRVFIDDVVVDGAVYCAGTGSVTAGPISEVGGGLYSFPLTDVAGVPMGATAVCTWDTPPDPVTGWDATWFRVP